MEKQKASLKQFFPFLLKDCITSTLIFMCAVCVCVLLQDKESSAGFASPVFVLAVLLISRFTTGYLFGLIASVLGVICVNYVFTYPFLEFNFSLSGYPLSFLALLAVSVITSALTSQTKQREQLRAEQERLRLENEKEKMRANLLRSVSHDIRTPLTSIVGATSTILENPGLSDDDRIMLLQDVRSDAQWLIQVVENLLSITRIGNDSATLQTQDEAAEEIVGEAVRKFRKRYPDLSVSVQVPDEILFVPMDPILIEQVLANLMENAVIHGEKTTALALKVERQGEWAVFSVRDNGVGIPEEELPRLFDGTLKHNETSVGDGKRNMGIGLSVCKAIVRAHQGEMSACNREEGAEFSFRLPLSLGGLT